ncbi:hypothetical protein PUN28_019241 [Cardiocondyla obscurior]|uniref:Uncharacterized protein n=1 Tax=Cardiocondyla obscurior TaxID=286306 RepID=A0AAW2ECJ6_9HYME
MPQQPLALQQASLLPLPPLSRSHPPTSSQSASFSPSKCVKGIPADTHNSLNILRSGRRSFENRRRTHGRGKIRETKYNPVGAGIAPSG